MSFKEEKKKGHEKEDNDEEDVQTCPKMTNINSTVEINSSERKVKKRTTKESKGGTSRSKNFQIRMISARVIKAGEELSFDYGPLYSPSDGWAL